MPTPAPVISAADAEKLLKGDLANLVQKVRRGEPLTRAQRNTLLAYQNGEANSTSFAKSWVELGSILGVTRRTLNTWSKRVGAPIPAPNGSHDVAAWREFTRANGLKGGDEDSEETEGEGIDELKRQKLSVEVQEREFRLSVLRKEYVPISAVRDRWQFNVEQAVMTLRKKLEDEAPPLLEGKTALEIRQELAGVVDSFISIMNAGGEEQ
ncbi:hypothetical protein [Verrucomicrobium sp. BvORR106]|uniref:hypothetical protein n=1 Tax=Verrucomicrobium sp. BvORR106 TaxID=1403819 RepID=UPI00056EE29E|nr:hypothetical protein [Verrucomicrobium sp. BvORR106]